MEKEIENLTDKSEASGMSRKRHVSPSEKSVSCSGYEQSSHPRIFLDLSKDITLCPYCGCQYIKKEVTL